MVTRAQVRVTADGPATRPAADGASSRLPDPCPSGHPPCPSGHRAPVQLTLRAPCGHPVGRCGALLPNLADSRTARAAGGRPSSGVHHRHGPASVPGCGARRVQSSMTGPCGTVRCPRQPPGSACWTRWTWTAGHCGQGRLNTAPLLVVEVVADELARACAGDDDHDQGDEQPSDSTVQRARSRML
jgi:hypothetical protein